jgi:putative transposase
MQAEIKDAYWKLFGVEGLKTKAWPEARRARLSPDHRDGGPVLGNLSGGDEVPARRPRRLDGLLAVPRLSTTTGSGTPIERTVGETRRRTKVIGRLPGETSCLTPVWAVLDGASRGWRGLTRACSSGWFFFTTAM